jgi:hypothetical protein
VDISELKDVTVAWHRPLRAESFLNTRTHEKALMENIAGTASVRLKKSHHGEEKVVSSLSIDIQICSTGTNLADMDRKHGSSANGHRR